MRLVKTEVEYFTRILISKSLLDKLISYPTGAPTSEIFWRSLIHDSSHNGSIDGDRAVKTMEYIIESTNNDDKYGSELQQVYKLKKTLAQWDSYEPTVVHRYRTWADCLRGTFVVICVARCVYLKSLPSLGGFLRWMAVYMASTLTQTAICLLYCRRICRKIELLRRRRHSHGEDLEAMLPALARSLSNIGRRLCITQTGYVAWAPRDVAEGDEICHFSGNGLPFVIRRNINQEGEDLGSYMLLGSCYLHGLMSENASNFPSGTASRIRIT